MTLTGQISLTDCIYIWWRHETWKCRIPKFDFLENGKCFRLNVKKDSKNVADTTFNSGNCHYLSINKNIANKLYWIGQKIVLTIDTNLNF